MRSESKRSWFSTGSSTSGSAFTQSKICPVKASPVLRLEAVQMAQLETHVSSQIRASTTYLTNAHLIIMVFLQLHYNFFPQISMTDDSSVESKDFYHNTKKCNTNSTETENTTSNIREDLVTTCCMLLSGESFRHNFQISFGGKLPV